MDLVSEDDRDDLDAAFTTDAWGAETDWNLIRESSGGDAGERREIACTKLVERYRIPVRRILRRHLRGGPASDDAVHDFFGYLFLQQLLSKADPQQGRFRCFIQGVIKRYAQSVRRSTSMSHACEDVQGADPCGPEETSVSEREEELVWAEAVLDHALERLRRTFEPDAELLVRFYGLGGVAPISGDKLAQEKGLKDNALHVGLHRARKRLHAALLDELRPMVSSREELVEERQFLVSRLLAAHPGLISG